MMESCGKISKLNRPVDPTTQLPAVRKGEPSTMSCYMHACMLAGWLAVSTMYCFSKLVIMIIFRRRKMMITMMMMIDDDDDDDDFKR